jgi:multiple sugar transport system substrate-binding protein
VFGGDFYDERAARITPTDDRVVAALEWMATYRQPFGANGIAAFRRGDQSLPGAPFPLLPSGDAVKGRYAMLMDGQWRVRDIEAWQQSRPAAGQPMVQFGVCPLPPPANGLSNAGWVNGNFFIVPRSARNAAGAWEFMKFWSGFGGHEVDAATTCAAGGWLPVSESVIAEPQFQKMLEQRPLLRTFVELSRSPRQVPIPVIPAAAAYKRAVEEAAERALSDEPLAPRELLQQIERRIQPLVTQGISRGA